MLPGFPDPVKRNLAKLICLILFLTLALFASPNTASAAPACNVPSSGNWTVNSDCELVRNEKAPRNVVVRNGSTLIVPNHRSLNINFADFSLRVASDSRVLVAPNGKIGICIVNFDRPRNQKVDADPHVDGNRFIEVLRHSLPLSRHMGYVAILQNSDLRNVSWDASGYAISNCDRDGPQPFTIDTPTAWGSVSKLITTSVVARLAQDSDRVDLGDRFGPYVPDRMSLDPKFRDVTYAQLLAHRAGLRKSAGSDLRTRLEKTYPYPPEASAVAKQFQGKCPPRKKEDSPDGKSYAKIDPEVGIRCYSNSGVGIAGRTILRAVSPGDTQTWENQHAGDSIQAYDSAFKDWSSRRYLEAAKNLVLNPSSIDFGREANCNMGQFQKEGRPYTLSYVSGTDPDGKLVKDNTSTCFSGGWVMSARHMARFMRTLRHSNAIVNRDTYGEMTACRMGFDGGGDGYVGGSGFQKNGLIKSNGHKYAAYVVMLPGGYTAVAASNSGNSSDLKEAIKNAFNASYSPPLNNIVAGDLGDSCPYWRS